MTNTVPVTKCCSSESEPRDIVSQTIKEFYDSVATGSGPYASQTDKFSPSAPTEKIVEYIHAFGKARILDLGCGMGTTLLRLVQEYAVGTQFIGVDFSEKMIERARNGSQQLPSSIRSKIGFFTADAQALPYMDGQFDLIYSECVFNLIPDREKAMREVERLLSPGGVFIYTDFVAFSPVPQQVRENLNLVSGCRAGSITLSENVAWLERQGFTGIECINFTADKNKRYAELMASSPEIRQNFEDFQAQHENSAKFLDEKVGYYLLVGIKGGE